MVCKLEVELRCQFAKCTGYAQSSIAAQDLTLGFGYNPAGQIISTTRSNDVYAWTGHYNVNRPYTVNGLNQLTAAGSLALGYDGRGNLTSSGSSAYGYSSENHLLSGPGGTLGYDPLGRLFQTTGGGTTTRFAYDGQALIGEYSGSSGLLRRYVHGPGVDEPLVWYEGAGTADRRWLHADERGSVIAITDGAGAAIGINAYDEYGIPAATNLGRFQYTGQTWLPELGTYPELGMYYYKARIYSPSLGRFLQTDPIGYADGMNWYAYAGNDPVNMRDPTGLDMTDCNGNPATPEEIPVCGGRRSTASLSGYGGVPAQSAADRRKAMLPGELPQKEGPCPPPSPQTMQRITNYAFSQTGHGGSTFAFTDGFSVLETAPNFSAHGWERVYNSHGGGTVSWQHDLGNTGYAIKVYIADSHHPGNNTVAIVSSGFMEHAFDAAAVASGFDTDDSRNYAIATGYFSEAGQCGGVGGW